MCSELAGGMAIAVINLKKKKLIVQILIVDIDNTAEDRKR